MCPDVINKINKVRFFLNMMYVEFKLLQISKGAALREAVERLSALISGGLGRAA